MKTESWKKKKEVQVTLMKTKQKKQLYIPEKTHRKQIKMADLSNNTSIFILNVIGH